MFVKIFNNNTSRMFVILNFSFYKSKIEWKRERERENEIEILILRCQIIKIYIHMFIGI